MPMTDRTKSHDEFEVRPARPYSRPVLVAYGDLTQLTATTQGGMTADNPGMEVNMTL